MVDRVFLFGFGFNWIHYKGRMACTKDAPIIIVAPHSSILDVFVVSLFTVPTFLARDDLRTLSFFGRESQFYPVYSEPSEMWLPIIKDMLFVCVHVHIRT